MLRSNSEARKEEILENPRREKQSKVVVCLALGNDKLGPSCSIDLLLYCIDGEGVKQYQEFFLPVMQNGWREKLDLKVTDLKLTGKII